MVWPVPSSSNLSSDGFVKWISPVAAVSPDHPKRYKARRGRRAGKFPAGSLLTVACQFAASEPEQKARNTMIAHCIGRNLARTDIFAVCDRSQIVSASCERLLFTCTKKYTRVLARVYSELS